MSAITIKAFAKINLGLRIVGTRPDGYHEIETTLQSLDLHDTLVLKSLNSSAIQLEVSSPWQLPTGRENLVYRAAELLVLRLRRDLGVRIVLEKRIPVGAGLGGGSSDAAATLVGLNELFHLGLGRAQLHELAVALGSDVPYFLMGGLCRGRGRGERLESLPPRFTAYHFVLAMPASALATADVYRTYDELIERGWRPPPARICENIDCVNDLEDAATELCPALRALREALERSHPELWGMSGSGPAYYAAWRSPERARHAAHMLLELGYAVYTTRPTLQGHELVMANENL